MNTSDLLTNRNNPQTRLIEETRGLVAKWEATGLLEGLKNDIEKSNMSVLLENQANQIINPIQNKNEIINLPSLKKISPKKEAAILYFNNMLAEVRK